MNTVLFTLGTRPVYGCSVMLALAAGVGCVLFLLLALAEGAPLLRASEMVLFSLVLSLVLGRLWYWYCRPDSYQGLAQALVDSRADRRALAGAFAGCALSALLLGKDRSGRERALDAMCAAGALAIAVGRLSNFFTTADRGRILEGITSLPLAARSVNSTTGSVEYRLATFMLQAIAAAALAVLLLGLRLSPRAKRKLPAGSVTLLFMMLYGAGQVLLDSTRYDSLYLPANGFVSATQVLAAILLVCGIVLSFRRAVIARGRVGKLPACWAAVAVLLGGAGYAEYFVQRHGSQAVLGYTGMALCLAAAVALAISAWLHPEKEKGGASLCSVQQLHQ